MNRATPHQATHPDNLALGPWLAINDDVMGGRSRGRVEASEAGLRFHGDLSLENNGGFASTRRLVQPPPSIATQLRLVVRGDGRNYQLRLRQDGKFDGVSWRALFRAGPDWSTVDLPLAGFEPVFRGTPMPNAGPLRPEAINQLGFLLADGQAGAFELSVKSIAFLPVA